MSKRASADWPSLLFQKSLLTQLRLAVVFAESLFRIFFGVVQYSETDEALCQSVNVTLVSLSAKPYSHYHDNHPGMLDLVYDPESLSDGTQAPITLKLSSEGFSLSLRFVSQAVYCLN
jgi:hypothetical protein